MYIGVTQGQEIMGVKGVIILSSAKKQGIQVFHGKQKSGHSVQLVPESFIQNFIVSHECEVGEKVEIDEMVYV